MKVKIFAVFALIAGFFLFAASFGSFYTVDQGERGVQLRYGKVTDIADPGLHFKMPFIEGVKFISTRDSKLIFKELTAYSADQQPATMRVSVTWGISEGEVAKVYTKYGSAEGLQTRVIEPKTFDTVKNVFGKFTAMNAIKERESFGRQVFESLRKDFEANPEVRLAGVQIEEIEFSQAYEDSIEQRMMAEVQIATQNQNLQTEKVKAEITVTQAKAQADSRLAQAEAEAKAIEIRGLAEAKAIEARARALANNSHLVDLNAIEKWDGKLPATMVPGSTVPFLNVK